MNCLLILLLKTLPWMPGERIALAMFLATFWVIRHWWQASSCQNGSGQSEITSCSQKFSHKRLRKREKVLRQSFEWVPSSFFDDEASGAFRVHLNKTVATAATRVRWGRKPEGLWVKGRNKVEIVGWFRLDKDGRIHLVWGIPYSRRQY